MEGVCGVLEQQEGMDAGHGEAGRCVCGQRHVDGLRWTPPGLSIAAIGSNIDRPPVDDPKPVGVFIHALAMTTKMPDSRAEHRYQHPGAEMGARRMRSQPYR